MKLRNLRLLALFGAVVVIGFTGATLATSSTAEMVPALENELEADPFLGVSDIHTGVVPGQQQCGPCSSDECPDPGPTCSTGGLSCKCRVCLGSLACYRFSL